ncbi:HlyD family secretion protein [Sphingomonas sp. HT-1]|uniref:HlyD family secretion protein n=1 Tax=unclassified Sphingomonas TaxID=196159 RepID=UPI0002D6CFB1|nr:MULTISPECIES: HlyD family efflux transporter periplasmic adaptor subunit [unclassified Sphingomonas]
MPFRPDHITHFPTLARMRPPRISRVIAWMIMFTVGVGAAVMIAVPWVQTAPGQGQVIALDPQDRAQSVTAFVPGRVDRWFVTDGQLVKKGDPIAKISDNDPELLARLTNERDQVLAEIASVENARSVASIDVNRARQMFQEGLAARREYEQAQIRVADQSAKLADSRAKLNRIQVSLSRQAEQIVRAPRDGRIQSLNAAASATLVSAGTELATLTPEGNTERVVELMIDGRDIALVRPGRRVRLEFEGWPAIQISGWPTAAWGLFDGRVRSIDPAAMPTGLFRVLIEPMPGTRAWPSDRFVRLGAKTRGWVQGETVAVGYELWRQLNDFPLEFGTAVKSEDKGMDVYKKKSK